ncbi:hypothetical protein [Streptomyces hygroscopicus]|nr:hypothetical protein [Streptomyces hygroscopicus]
MRHHRQPPTERAAPPASRTARQGLTLSTMPLLPVLALHLCVAGDSAR